MEHVVIILPTYNEHENIASLIVAIKDVVKTIKGFRFSILVVDDNSPDGTADIVESLMKKHSNVFLLQGKKKGLGAAYIRGMTYAIEEEHADVVIEMDADWSHDPKLLVSFLSKINKRADFVIGSRYIRNGSIPENWGIHRKIFSLVGNGIVRFGLGKLKIHDWTSGYRAIRSKVFNKVHRGLNKYAGYTFQVAFLNRANMEGFTIVEVPLQFIDRKYGNSKIVPFEYIKNVLWYVFHHSILLKYLVVGVIGFIVQTLVAKGLIEFRPIINRISHFSFVDESFAGVAVGIGAFCAIVANFFGNNLWTFSHKRLSGIRTLFRKFTHFLATSVGAVVIQVVVVGIGVKFFGEDAWFILMIFAIGFLVIPYNFFVYNRFIWKTHEK